MPAPRKHHPAPKPELPEKKPEVAPKIRLKLIGVGGAGCNTVSHIAAAREKGPHALAGVELLAINTDVQALQAATAGEKLQIGAAITHGLGAGGDSEAGARSAQGDAEKLQAAMQGADVVFITAGFGGGTGTGASAVVARLAKEQGALVLAFVAMPFGFEGERRQQQAVAGLDQLKQHADAVICIPNDKLFKILGENASVVDSFKRCDEMIANGAQAIWQLVARKGLINLDFADIRATLGAKHYDGLFSHGEAEGQNKAREAVKKLLENPLFEGGDALARAEGVLVSILGGPDLTLADVQRAIEPITRQARRARVVMGAAIDDSYRGRLAITVIAATNIIPRRFPQPTPARVSPLTRASVPPVTRNITPAPAPAAPEPKKAKPKQESLPLETVTRGRFDKGEPTLYDGEDLDVPTFIRRGVALKR